MLNGPRLFACLGDNVRLATMLLLHTEEELCVCELVEAMNENQSKISRHLAQLRNCALVADRRQGQWVYYRLHPDLPEWALNVLEEASAAEAATLETMMTRLNAMQNRPERVCCDD